MSSKRCPRCGACQECGHVPTPYVPPYLPYVPFSYPTTNPWPYHWTVSPNISIGGSYSGSAGGIYDASKYEYRNTSGALH